MLTGSSQLTRGTLGGSDIRAGLCRFIPACAGNSSKSMPGAPSNTVHPRLRGELKSIEGIDICWCGSSPLTRGTLLKLYGRGNGETVHPRLRGELFLEGVLFFSAVGSSPLTRGTPGSSEYSWLARRFIPAYAGNSLRPWTTGWAWAVHPRVSGELCRTRNNSHV